jgi:diaminopimelate decarboxylase
LNLARGRVLFAGPGKRTEELALALEMGVRVQAEGWEDLERLDRLASHEVGVNLRVHPRAGVLETSPIIGGVGPSAFGVDEEEVPTLLERAKALRQVRIQGLHVFAASNQRDAHRLLDTHAMVLELGKRLHETFGLPLEQIDLGGGLGVPYAPEEAPLELAILGQGLSELLESHAWFQGELILEPGRFLAAPCGIYLARVTRMKESRGVRFAILEGGVNHLLRPLLTGQAFPVKAIGKEGSPRLTTLAGPLCTSLDRLGDVFLPDLEPGDLLAFGTTGAYGFTEAMTHFLSHPVPPEVWVD